MAFGISFGWGKIFLSLFSILAAFGLCWYLYKLRSFSKWVQFGIALMLAGAVGNLIDRVFYGVFYGEAPLFYGKVVDFIDVNLPDISLGAFELSRFWVFNIADSCVTCGVIVLLFVHDKIPTWDELKAGRYFKKDETVVINATDTPAHEASF
jgi:signal peptidase II